MKSLISAAIVAIALCEFAWSESALRESTLRNAAISAGFVPAEETHFPIDLRLTQFGNVLLESKLLSTNGDVSCATCHVDQFGSADGLPNAVGVGGLNLGSERLNSTGRLVPRNTLPFWGRGGVGFDVFFWDGKVSGSGESLVSQFGNEAPSDDPLVVAAHLPPVEIDEMFEDDGTYRTETVKSATQIYELILGRLKSDPEIAELYRSATGRNEKEMSFLDVTEAIASFIRWNFALQETRFHSFVFGGGQLSKNEIEGGLLFYGKGRCAACHNGPYFSDFDFHAIPSPSVGFGKNGFGVDYGRFNVTLDPSDRGKFRTPPLYNVSKTAPYMHSGSVLELEFAIIAHSDPLAIYDQRYQNAAQRQDFYQQLRMWSHEPVSTSVLSADEISKLVSFLKTLNYSSRRKVDSK